MLLKLLIRLKYRWHRARMVNSQLAMYRHEKIVNKLCSHIDIEKHGAPIYMEWPPGSNTISAGSSRLLVPRQEADCDHKQETFMSNNTHVKCPSCGRIRPIERTDW